MNNFILVISFCGFILGATACGILLFSNKRHRHANHLLSVAIFSMTAAMLATFLNEWNIGLYAYIYRFPTPLYYLIMPAAYLYTRAVIHDEVKLKRKDIIHFIPAVLRLFEMLPFYFTSYEYRKAIISHWHMDLNNLVRLEEGILPSYYHLIIMSLLGLGYLVGMIRIIRKACSHQSKICINYLRTFRWLKFFTALIVIISVPVIFFGILSDEIRMQLLLTTACICFLATNFYLFFQPEILYGIPRMSADLASITPTAMLTHQSNGGGEAINETLILREDVRDTEPQFSHLETYKIVLEQYINSVEPFLKQSYTIFDLSKETGIPQHHLSALFNRVYGMRFNEFMNRRRIDYIIQNFHNNEWRNLTLEGIAKQAGFNSRTTFFNSIKKNTGLSPSGFMEKVRLHQNNGLLKQ